MERDQFELKDVGTVLRFGAGLNGGVLVAHEGIVVAVVVPHRVAKRSEGVAKSQSAYKRRSSTDPTLPRGIKIEGCRNRHSSQFDFATALSYLYE